MRKYLAEFLATFALVFAGTGSVIINAQYGGAIGHLGIAITFGLVIMSMIYAIGDISGAHMNPAVSIAFAVAGKFPVKELPAYIIVQITGALAASFALKFLFPVNGTVDVFLGTTLPAGSEIQSFIMEVILTFFLMLVIITVATGSKEQGMFAGIAIGATVCLEVVFAGQVSGTSLNPARSIAPALASNHLEHLWIYLVAPIIGAVGAVPIYNVLKGKK